MSINGIGRPKIPIDEQLAGLPQRFWAKVDIRGHQECWLWQACLNKKGYGKIGVLGRTEIAPRIAWKLTHGEIPDRMLICHSCDNPRCVNPGHLFVGTHLDNSLDMMRKKRHGTFIKPGYAPAGERHGRVKLTASQVSEIRGAPARYGVVKGFTRRFGVSRSLILQIRKGLVWKKAIV